MDTKCVFGLITFSTVALAVCSALECYKCENEESNFMCINENLKECEHPKMDTCQTIVAYSAVSEKLSITKRCTKEQACSAQINATMDSDPCDPHSGRTWVCTTCCYETACNYNGAVSNTPTTFMVTLVTFCGVIISGLKRLRVF